MAQQVHQCFPEEPLPTYQWHGCAANKQLRLEFIMCNHHHILAFELWDGDDFGSSTLRFTPRWSMFGLIQEFHSISSLPVPHHEYTEWLEKVDIGIHALKWSPQRVFQS
eukprot:scaffold89038_cov51-Cyclotella_meneghiniana.AAC.5